jgi:hypothetical protein
MSRPTSFPCALIAYSSFSDVYRTIMYQSNFSALKVKDNDVSCEIFTKIGDAYDEFGLMQKIRKNVNDYLIYPYVISRNTKINKDGCDGLEFILVPYAKPDHIIGFIEGGLLSKNKMVLMRMKKDVDLMKIKSINSYTDVIDEKDYQKGAKIIFSGELDNKIMGSEYSYLKVSEKSGANPSEKIGFTPFGNFSLNNKSVPCAKDYCNVFFLPIDITSGIKRGKIEPLSQGSYNYAGTTKMAGVAAVAADIAAVATGSYKGSSISQKIQLHETKVSALPVCFGYRLMPGIGVLAGGYYSKYMKYLQKIESLENVQ